MVHGFYVNICKKHRTKRLHESQRMRRKGQQRFGGQLKLLGDHQYKFS